MLFRSVDDLSNWYVRRSRRRFWKSEMGPDKLSAFQTLYECLITLSKLIAPLAPFLSEAIYGNLNQDSSAPESVHLCLYPRVDEAPLEYQDDLLEERMHLVRRIVELGRSIRNDVGVRVRQPLSTLYVVAENERRQLLLQGMEHLVLEELNVKNITFVDDESKLMTLKAEPVFKHLGPKFGKLVNQAAEAIRSFGENEIHNIQTQGGERLVIDGHESTIVAEDINIETENKAGVAANSEGDLTVALATDISDELLNEGLAREFVNRVQNMRKEAGFEVTDRIRIYLDPKTDERIRKAVETMQQYINNETLCVEINTATENGTFHKEWNIDDLSVSVGISKVN